MERSQLQEIAALCEGIDSLQALFLFGSQARGTATSESDFDFGFVAEDEQDVRDELLKRITKLGVNSVDLVPLNGSDRFLDFQATAPGKIVFARKGFDPVTFRLQALKAWLDFKPCAERQAKALKERLNGE